MKKLSLLILVVILISISFRVYYVNKDSVRDYKKDEYRLLDEIFLDEFKVKVVSIEKGETSFNSEYDRHETSVIAILEVIILEEKDIDINYLSYRAFTSIEKNTVVSEYKVSKNLESIKQGEGELIKRDASKDFGKSKEISDLKGGEKVYIAYEWNYDKNILDRKGMENIEIYFDRELFKNEVLDNYKKGIIYNKSVKQN